MFDEDVSYYTTMITDNNNNTIYNNADMVVAFSKKQVSLEKSPFCLNFIIKITP